MDETLCLEAAVLDRVRSVEVDILGGTLAVWRPPHTLLFAMPGVELGRGTFVGDDPAATLRGMLRGAGRRRSAADAEPSLPIVVGLCALLGAGFVRVAADGSGYALWDGMRSVGWFDRHGVQVSDVPLAEATVRAASAAAERLLPAGVCA